MAIYRYRDTSYSNIISDAREIVFCSSAPRPVRIVFQELNTSKKRCPFKWTNSTCIGTRSRIYTFISKGHSYDLQVWNLIVTFVRLSENRYVNYTVVGLCRCIGLRFDRMHCVYTYKHKGLPWIQKHKVSIFFTFNWFLLRKCMLS